MCILYNDTQKIKATSLDMALNKHIKKNQILIHPPPSTNSKMSPGWHSNTLQITSNVLNLIALAFPVFNIERFESERSTFSDSSFNDIFLLAIMTSKFTIIGILYG